MARYLRPDLLIIDDMGIKQLPKRSGEYLFEIIMPAANAEGIHEVSSCPCRMRMP